MNTITNTKDYVVKGIFSINASFKKDNESTESKNVVLRVHCDNVPLSDIVTKALSPIRISWQNNVGRKNFDTIKDRSTINIDFSSPAKKVKSDEEKIEELAHSFMLAGIPEEQAYELATKAVTNPELIQK